jgi:hypothetical protein
MGHDPKGLWVAVRLSRRGALCFPANKKLKTKMITKTEIKSIGRKKWLWISGGLILFIVLVSIIGRDKKTEKVESPQTSQPQVSLEQQPQVSLEQQAKNDEPQLKSIGKWYNTAEVFLGRSEVSGRLGYGAVFEPPLEPTKQNMAQFAIGLIDEVWGRNALAEGVLTPIGYEERLGTTLIYYEMKDGGRVYFLVVKASDIGGKIVGMTFWKEK